MTAPFPPGERVLGLKIDVDTFNGARRGVPTLLALLRDAGVKATFLLSIGVDNMGRHAWRLLRPRFLGKMLRGNAAKLYGWDILFKGLLWPGPDIGRRLAATLRQIPADGHEAALHALDHYAWQTRVARATPAWARAQISAALARWAEIFPEPPMAAGSPGWQLSPAWLAAMEAARPWLYLSDTRGPEAGLPDLDGHSGSVLQLPTTLPTFDEAVGRNGMTPRGFYDATLAAIAPGRLNVFCAHAEVEGGAYAPLFAQFLRACAGSGVKLWRMDALAARVLSSDPPRLPARMGLVPGRDGPVALLGRP